ncbi:MAG TPA: DinB family protein [Edaphocola sp.]|nr:DinB family protein [Edaphocola sp.]
MKKIKKPHFTEFALYYEQYINLISEDKSVLDQLKASAKEINNLIKSLDEDQLIYQYAKDKWCIKDIIMHLIDFERVFVYRAMHFARGDRRAIPFFDEKEFAIEAQAPRINTRKLLKEYTACRNLTINFFNNLNAQQMKRTGIASNFTMSVNASAWIILGHELHHRTIIKQLYLKEKR